MPSLQKHFKCNSFVREGNRSNTSMSLEVLYSLGSPIMYSEFASSVSSLYVQAQTHGGQLIKVAGQKGWI